MTTLRGSALALLRFNYHLARIPLQLAEWGVLSRLDEKASTRLAYAVGRDERSPFTAVRPGTCVRGGDVESAGRDCQ